MNTIKFAEIERCPECGINDLVGSQKICLLCYNAHEEKLRIERIKKNIREEVRKRGVRLKYLDCSFQNYEQTEHNLKMFDGIRSIPRDYKGSIFFTSKRSGTGKTHLAVAMMRDYLLSGMESIYFISSPWLFLEIKNSYDTEENERAIIEKYCSYKVLIIDDIGVERVSGWALQIWYMIIDRRDADNKTTIYTSNLSAGDIAEKLDTRISSRVSSGYVFTFQGNDYRIRKAK